MFNVGYDDTPIPVDRNAITLWLFPNVFNALVESFSCRRRVQDDGHRRATKTRIGHRSDVEPLLIFTYLNSVDPDGEVKKPPNQSVGPVWRLNNPVFGD